MSHTVLYVGGEAVPATLAERFAVERAPSPAAARDRFDPERVDCVVSSDRPGVRTAFELFAAVRSAAPETPCVLWTDGSSPDPVPDLPGVEVVERGDGLGRAVETALETADVAAPVPADEVERLAALERYDVESLGVEPAFERLATLAARHVGAPVAFVAIVDADEQRFLATHGADWAPLDRAETLCAHTLDADRPFAVEDTLADPRFAGIDSLRRRDVRSYLGTPLRTPEGHALGTFCVCDRHPRAFTADAREALAAFAAEAAEQVEFRHRLRERDARDGAPGEAGTERGPDGGGP